MLRRQQSRGLPPPNSLHYLTTIVIKLQHTITSPINEEMPLLQNPENEHNREPLSSIFYPHNQFP
jgi:hypothetical protein